MDHKTDAVKPKQLRDRCTKEVTVDTSRSTAPHARPSAEEHEHKRPVRLYACACCGRRLRLRELVELHEGNHDNLTYFHGDRLCRACADNAGVEY
jgi:hypothetical protein